MKTVILWYPGGAGGKFLINCLALSRHCYLQHNDLIRRQASNNLTTIDKFNHLINELNLIDGKFNDGVHVPGTWTDFRMGNGHIFTQPECEIIDPELPSTVGDGLIFFTAHGGWQGLSDTFLKKYPESTVILFTKFNKFIAWRSEHGNTQYDIIDRFDVPKFNTTVFEWDADTYLNEAEFLPAIENLYAQLGLDDFNRDLIQQFHAKYIDTLANLK